MQIIEKLKKFLKSLMVLVENFSQETIYGKENYLWIVSYIRVAIGCKCWCTSKEGKYSFNLLCNTLYTTVSLQSKIISGGVIL